MLDLNPYAPPNPLEESLPADLVDSTPPTCWRHGYFIVLRTGSPLPERCVRTNAEADYHVPLHAYEQFAWLARLANCLEDWIPALRRFTTITATVQIPLGERWRYAQRSGFKLAMAIGVLLACTAAVVTIGTLIATGSLFEGATAAAMTAIYPTVFFVAAAGTRSHGVRIYRVQSDYILLRGGDPLYLRSLPKWPGDPALKIPRFSLW